MQKGDVKHLLTCSTRKKDTGALAASMHSLLCCQHSRCLQVDDAAIEDMKAAESSGRRKRLTMEEAEALQQQQQQQQGEQEATK